MNNALLKDKRVWGGVVVAVLVAIAIWYFVFRKDSNDGPSTQHAGRPRRSAIAVDSRANMGMPDTHTAASGRVGPYPCLFMPGGPTQETNPICNENIPWFPPYNRGTWPERFPGRFAGDYAPDYVAPLNERFYQSDVRAQDIAQQIDEQTAQKKAKNSLMNSFARAAGTHKSSAGNETPAAGNEGFTKTNFSNISFPSYPGMYELRSEYASPLGTVPQAQSTNMARSLADANVARTQHQNPGFNTPAHAESHYSANADLMSRKKKDVPKELAHLSDADLAALVQDEIETQQSFKSDQPLELPISPDGYDPMRDITTEIHHNFMSQGKGVLSRYANKDVVDKVNNLYRQNVLPTEEEIEYDIHSYVRPTKREVDQWKMYPTYETRPAVKSVMQDYNYPAYTNQDFTFQDTDGQSVNTSFGP